MPAIQAEGLIVERCGSELVVFVPATNEAHSLNPTALLIFERCDGATSRAEMVAALESVGLPADPGIVSLALSDLAEASLVVIDDEAPQLGVTRRVVIRRLGLSATAIAMLPVVETIFVQPAAAQTSGNPPPPPPP
jgi:coenzyme PQQ synthesis protein D (PqqD)